MDSFFVKFCHNNIKYNHQPCTPIPSLLGPPGLGKAERDLASYRTVQTIHSPAFSQKLNLVWTQVETDL